MDIDRYRYYKDRGAERQNYKTKFILGFLLSFFQLLPKF